MSDFTARPGQSVDGYDVTRRLGTDYYAVFADIPEADRVIWQRAQGFIDEVGDRMLDAWDRAEYPLDLAQRLGELDLLDAFGCGQECDALGHVLHVVSRGGAGQHTCGWCGAVAGGWRVGSLWGGGR